MRRSLIPALAVAAVAGAAAAQTSVDIRTGPGGQLSGSATAGGVASHVDTGDPGRPDRGYAQGARSEAHCTGNGRTMTVTSPDGSSGSSVSTSTSDGGTVSVGGGGSPGARVRTGDCDGGNRAAFVPGPATAVAGSASASTPPAAALPRGITAAAMRGGTKEHST